VQGVKPGVYRYVPELHKLCLLYLDADIAEKFYDARGGDRLVKTCAVYFVWAAVPYRKEWIYGFWADKLVAVEVGHVCQNLHLASEAIGCGTCATAVVGRIGPGYDRLLGVDGIDEFSVYAAAVGKVRQGREVEWSGQIEEIDADEDLARLRVASFSWWEGDVFMAEFPCAGVIGYAPGDYVLIRGEIVEMCSDYDGWPLVRGAAIERRADPDAVSED
jgi:SagB-type dehydrogenase family enzyme